MNNAISKCTAVIEKASREITTNTPSVTWNKIKINKFLKFLIFVAEVFW